MNFITYAADENKVEFIYYLLLNYSCVPDKCLYENQKIRKIAIPSSITTIEYSAFYVYNSLTHVTIPSSVTSNERYAFKKSRSLIHVTIHSSVNSIKRDALDGCSSLKQITYSSSVNSFGEFAFYYCESLTQVTIPSSTLYTSIIRRRHYVPSTFHTTRYLQQQEEKSIRS